MNQPIRNIGIVVLAFVMLSAFFSLARGQRSTTTRISLDQLAAQVTDGEVKRITIRDAGLTIERNDGRIHTADKETVQPLTELLHDLGVPPAQIAKIHIEVKGPTATTFVVSTLLPFLIPFFLVAGLLWLMVRQVQGVNRRALSFGQATMKEMRPEDKKHRATFKDVAGVKEAKEELIEIVEFLKTPKKFIALGAKIPKGVLLMGPPGTGKTLLARAVAGEADVPFFHMSASEFVEMFVGVGASRVRSAFAQAKKAAPSIIFIDELDAIGRQRGTGMGGGHDEREQTLNQILVEMDGFDPNSGTIVMAATNRADVLDPALLRPGRFDRHVTLDLPDINDREAILQIHAKGKPVAEGVNLRRIAERTPGFSGADLANVMNEAAILAARQNTTTVVFENLASAIEKVLLGPERKSHLLSDKEKITVAYHESGHALVAYESPGADPVHKVSIISRGRAAGYTLKLPTQDRRLHRRDEMLANLASLLGGYAAELEVMNELTTGAGDDLRKATMLTRELVTAYGMSEKLGPRTFGEREEVVFLGRSMAEQRDYSEATAEEIDKEVDRILGAALKSARAILKNKRLVLDRIAKVLLEKETLERDEFEAICSAA